jgi:ribose 5-phosphate isomerase A
MSVTPTNIENQNNGPFDSSFDNIARNIIDSHISNNEQLIGLGSGRAVTKIVKLLSPQVVQNCKFVCTSLQIKIEAEKKNLEIVDESQIPLLDLVIDGADQIDKQYHLIKGGGGALLREKILYHSAKKTIIVADSSKFVEFFSRSVPIEIIPFGRNAVIPLIAKIGGNPSLRLLDRGYPYITENGNLILDTLFNDYSNIENLEAQLKKIPGIMETGLFIKPPDHCFSALKNGKFVDCSKSG